MDYATFDTIVRTALRQWLSADCGGGKHPALTLWDTGDTYGPVVCNKPEYNKEAPNANVWMLRDTDWPYHDPGSTFGHTTFSYDGSRGAIYDADVEINSFGLDLTTSDQDTIDDLQSIATHEAGHFFGLGDSSVADATMNGAYSPANRSARSLSPDDVDGICTLYPPSGDASACADPAPNHGFSRYCGADAHASGCAIGARGQRRAPLSSALVAAAAMVVRRRARRRGSG